MRFPYKVAPITSAGPEQRISCPVGVSIMIPALRHFQRLCLALTAHAIDQPMLAIDAAGSPATEVSAERFGLAGAAEGIAHAFLEQAVQAIERLSVFRLPIEIILPGSRPEDDLHGSINSCSSPSPASRPRTASISRSAFFGDCNR